MCCIDFSVWEGTRIVVPVMATRVTSPLTQHQFYPSTNLVQQHDQTISRVDSRLAPSQWETSLQSNAVSHWLGANLESALSFVAAAWLNHLVQHHNQTIWCSSTTKPLVQQYNQTVDAAPQPNHLVQHHNQTIWCSSTTKPFGTAPQTKPFGAAPQPNRLVQQYNQTFGAAVQLNCWCSSTTKLFGAAVQPN